MKILFVGDVHSNLDGLHNVQKANPDIDVYIQVGDLGFYATEETAKGDKAQYEKHHRFIRLMLARIALDTVVPFEKPVYFIKGNHDDYDSLDTDYMKKLNIHYIPQTGCIAFDNCNIVGLGGVYSSVRTAWETKRLSGRERRFYTLEELKSMRKLYADERVDVLMTHQASAGILPNRNSGWDEGSTYIQALLEALSPTYYIHGHHHINYETTHKDSIVFGLGNFSKNNRSCRLFETTDEGLKLHEA